jgi:hypothetical protein
MRGKRGTSNDCDVSLSLREGWRYEINAKNAYNLTASTPSFPSPTIQERKAVFNTRRKNEKGEFEVAICPLCNLRVEFIGAPMVRCYTRGETYDPEKIIWTLESKVSKETGYDVENIRGNDKEQDFLPNAHSEDEK